MIFRLGYNKYDFLLFIIYYLFLLFILLFSLIGQNRKSSQSELPLGGVLLVPTHVRTATWLILPVVIHLIHLIHLSFTSPPPLLLLPITTDHVFNGPPNVCCKIGYQANLGQYVAQRGQKMLGCLQKESG